MQVIVARTSEHYSAAVMLFKEYALGLGIDLKFQKFDDELQILSTMYGPPTGELWLIKANEQFVGCAALRQLDKHTCELKRMFIQPAFRGLHLGEQLMEVAIDTARKLGYTSIKLDSLRRLAPAVKLYLRYGFTEIHPYNFNPEEDVVYFEKKLLGL
ncbi:GNAT family N-acetyltransferase [Runella sp. CRIBMP]|uniref:GNAT family N-acetyltransferase n=1 Tax=Runella sp. CRIBMP TaxID=2683261 RepID=UPI00141322BB|nr:GNAT family N-acetyltransferase [Runella sp. CRIBMP]NBB20949.1 GNAT family N-acetyltransferase [Runella sp. CRIBMP]